MGKADILYMVQVAVRDAGSQAQAARNLGVSRQAINDALKPNQFISPCLAAALGLERVWTYRIASARTANTTPAPAAATSSARQ
jgi:hypothetical protein